MTAKGGEGYCCPPGGALRTQRYHIGSALASRYSRSSSALIASLVPATRRVPAPRGQVLFVNAVRVKGEVVAERRDF